jgi:hypothetical protein
MKEFLKWLDGGSWAANIVAAILFSLSITGPFAVWWFFGGI